MLTYRDSYGYSIASREKIDAELQQLLLLCKSGKTDYDLYQQIRQYCFREIKVEELAITKILGDLLQVKSKSESNFNVLLAFVANPLNSYSELGQSLNISKQRVHEVVCLYAVHFPWLQNLRAIKGEQDCKNDNNRGRKVARSGSKSVSVKKTVKKPSKRALYQPCLFDVGGA